MWRSWPDSNRPRILSRGKVDLRPAFFRCSGCRLSMSLFPCCFEHIARKCLQTQMRTIIVRTNHQSRIAMKKISFAALLLPMAAFAADADFTLVIKEHRFQPSELVIP